MKMVVRLAAIAKTAPRAESDLAKQQQLLIKSWLSEQIYITDQQEGRGLLGQINTSTHTRVYLPRLSPF